MNINPLTGRPGITPVKETAPQIDKIKGNVKPPDMFEPAADLTDVNPASQTDARVIQGAKLLYEALPEVRNNLIEKARQRVLEGFYEKTEVKAETVRRMMADPEIEIKPPLTTQRKEDIEKRLEDEFYNRDEVKDRIARGLLDDAK